MSHRDDMETEFDRWWQMHRRRTWKRTRILGDPVDPPRTWGFGHRPTLLEGWMGAVLWCRLCLREHEGPCVSDPTVKSPHA